MKTDPLFEPILINRVAGDAHRLGLAFDAVHHGFAAGREIG